MNRLALGLSLAMVFAAASCDEDDAPKKLDGGAGVGGSTGGSGGSGGSTGGSGGSGGTAGVAGDGGAPAMCTGSFSTINRATLGAATKPTGACAAPADLDLICTKNIASIAGVCGQGCVGMGETCIKNCVKMMAALGDACLGCYAQTVLCTQTMCLAECITDPTAPACTACQVAKGCRGTFFTCSGLPGGPTTGDGGTDGAAGDGGAGDGGAIDAAQSEGGTTVDAAADMSVAVDTAADTAAVDTAPADTAAADTASDTSTD